MAPPPPRKDRKLPDVIISEKRSGSTASHQVNQLPFFFENIEQFESTIRSPIGQTWNTPSAVVKLTKPKVLTKLGAIIEPIVKEDFINKPPTSAHKRPAITLGGDTFSGDPGSSSEKPQKKKTQKRKNNSKKI